MHNISSEISISNRPTTAFTMNHRTNQSISDPISNTIPYKIFQNLAIKEFLEISSSIRIRPLTAVALLASETNSPKKCPIGRINKLRPKHLTDNYYTPCFSKSSTLYGNETTKFIKDIKEINIDMPKLKVKQQRHRYPSFSLDYTKSDDIKERSKLIKTTEKIKENKTRIIVKGKIKKGNCMRMYKFPVARLIHNLKLSM